MSARRFESILETIGDTPVVRIRDLAPAGVGVWAKLEAFNPLGSVKDRMALEVVEQAERSGQLRPGQTVVEATSGNTGIGLAMVCARKGYPLVVVMAENFSVERRRLMRFLGARVVLTPASERGTGMLAKAAELAEAHGWFLCRQFQNQANADVHSRTTAREILEAFEGERLDAWVSGFGTGGTLKGVARVLKERRPDTRIVACEPDNSPMLASGIPQPRDAAGNPSAGHPRFRTHLVQGWAPDFVPTLAEEAMTAGWVDEIVPVNGDEALRLSRQLARREGILTGISGGATLAGALRVAETAGPGANILCMLPDTGERYLSTPLFEDVSAEMTDEEVEISRSTPGFRFDAPAGSRSVASVRPEAPAVGPAAEAFISRAIDDPDRPVVVFGLTYCEFCWAARRLLDAWEVPYLSIDLDAGELGEQDRGGEIREALRARTSSHTVPQIFIGGEHVGGCTALAEAARSGALEALLGAHGIPFNASASVDPATLLPSWLHPR